jgi:hypothetical protein
LPGPRDRIGVNPELGAPVPDTLLREGSGRLLPSKGVLSVLRRQTGMCPCESVQTRPGRAVSASARVQCRLLDHEQERVPRPTDDQGPAHPSLGRPGGMAPGAHARLPHRAPRFRAPACTPRVVGTWRFTDKAHRGAEMDVPLAAAIQACISGETIPALARAWLPGVPAEWARGRDTSRGSAVSRGHRRRGLPGSCSWPYIPSVGGLGPGRDGRGGWSTGRWGPVPPTTPCSR